LGAATTDLTEFGKAFIRDAVPGAPSLAAEERRRNLAESLPQARIGVTFSAHWERIEAQHAPAAAKAR
jgi:hypothetical protein